MLRYNNMRHRELPLSTDSSNLFLKVMISIAVFLFAVTLAGVLSINSMLVNWNSSILGSLTVQIIPVNGVDKLKAKNETLIQEQRAAAMLEAMPEVQKVTPLNDGQLERLLKIPDPHIHLGTDFGAARTQIEGEAGVAFRIGDLLIIGLGFGIPLLKWLRKRKKEIEQSVKAAPPPAQEQTAS